MLFYTLPRKAKGNEVHVRGADVIRTFSTTTRQTGSQIYRNMHTGLTLKSISSTYRKLLQLKALVSARQNHYLRPPLSPLYQRRKAEQMIAYCLVLLKRFSCRMQHSYLPTLAI
jgi:hypothetical protein